MFVRSVAVVAAALALGVGAPALARPVAKSNVVKAASPHLVDPARVLAGTSRGFADRTASMTSIMGPNSGPVARMEIPLRPEHPRGLRREADATASLR